MSLIENAATAEKKEVLRLEHLEKAFGDHQVLRDINLSVNRGEVISIIGASGSGKSAFRWCELFELQGRRTGPG